MHTDYESGEVRGRLDGDIEKTVRHLLVRTPLLTKLRIAETHNIKADVRTAGTLNTDCMQAYHHARSTGCRL